MHVLVINLANSHQRRQSISKQLSELSIDFSFIEAIDGRNSHVSDFPQYDNHVRRQLMGREMRAAEIACVLSHFKAMRYAQQHGWKRVCILEDDAHIEPHFAEHLTYIDQLPLSYDLVSLGNYKVKDTATRTLRRSRFKQWSGAVGYVVTTDAIGKILDYHKKIKYIADQAIMGRPDMGVAVWYLLPKAVKVADSLGTDIGTGRGKRNYRPIDRLRRLRFLIADRYLRAKYVIKHLPEFCGS